MTPSAELAAALERASDLGDDGSAVRAGERLAHAMASLPPVISMSRVPLGPMWLEPWAACLPLQHAVPVRLLRTATVVSTPTGVVCIDPALPEAYLETPLGERMRSLHPKQTRETSALTLHQALGPEGPFTEVIFTSLRYQSLRALLGTTHGDGVEAALAPFFPNARFYIAKADWHRALQLDELASHPRAGLARLRDDHLELVERPTLLPSGLVLIPTPGLTPGHLTVALTVRTDRPRIAVATSNATTREALSPYESALPGLREHARLRDTDLAPRGDALDQAAHQRSLRFERALADRDPEDPRFHDVLPSLRLTP